MPYNRSLTKYLFCIVDEPIKFKLCWTSRNAWALANAALSLQRSSMYVAMITLEDVN